MLDLPLDSQILLSIGIASSVLIVVLTLFLMISRNYIKVSPNKAAVISGRRRKLPNGAVVGYRLVRGGATLVIPFFEKVEYMDVNVLTVPFSTSRAYTFEGVPISVKAVANVKIKGDDSSLRLAAERFLGMDDKEFQKLIFQTLEGHLHAVLGTLTVEEINNNRLSFAQKLTTKASTDLGKMGIGLDALTIQEMSDDEGYLDALGKRRTAEVKGDAEIGEAEAKRDSKIKASLALQEGEKVRLATEAQIARSNRETEIQKAQVSAEIEKERAQARQAGPLAEALAKQEVVAEEVRIEKIRTQEQLVVKEKEVMGKQNELQTMVVKRAEAERQASILKAKGEREAQILAAEGQKQSQLAEAEAEAEKLCKEGEGRAKAIEAEAKAEAEKIRMLGAAEAEKLEVAGVAKAKAMEAQGLAEARATMEKAIAWREFTDAARLQTILEKLPEIIEAAAPVFKSVAEPLSSIEKVVMIENGGNGDGNSSGLNRFVQTSPNLIFNLLQQMQALGLNLPDMLSQLGVEHKDGKFKLSTNGNNMERNDENAEDKEQKEIESKPKAPNNVKLEEDVKLELDGSK